jgi:hypothetical protein
MLIGLLFALLAVLCGLTITRVLRVPTSLAPLSGLASMVVMTTLTTGLRLPSVAGTALVVSAALAGLVSAALEAKQALTTRRASRLASVVVFASAAIPALILGLAFAGVEAPVSTHDGAFHVETIDSLRRGVPVQTWYPMGFHTTVAAVLGLVPSLDTARGAFEAAQGLAILAPLGIVSLGLAFGLEPLIAASGAIVLALTWTYPYDYHLWSGWPQGMGVLLLLGLWATAVRWLERPRVHLAILGGVFAGAIVLTHGTEVYSSLLGLFVIASARIRRFAPGPLVRHLPLAVGVAVVIAFPYLPTLVGWAGAGGATAAGQEIVDHTAANPAIEGYGDWLQYVLGGFGAGSLIELPLRVALIGLGLKMRRMRLVTALWAAFLGLLLVVDFVDLPIVKGLFIVTYPWLADQRPRQVVVVFASLLAAGGVWQCMAYLGHLRTKFVGHPNTSRRLAAVCGLMIFFFGEGSGVAISKRLAQGVAEQNVYFADEAAAMGWLRRNTQPGDVLANDLAGDAGIWAPYKAGVTILLPRSAPGPVMDARRPILESVQDLNDSPHLAAEACGLHVAYLFHGAAPVIFDERMFPDRAALERAVGLEEVFSSGDAAVFRIRLPCN